MTKVNFIVKTNEGIKEFNSYNEAKDFAEKNDSRITQDYEEIKDGEMYLLKKLDNEKYEEIKTKREEHQNKMNLRNDNILQVV